MLVKGGGGSGLKFHSFCKLVLNETTAFRESKTFYGIEKNERLAILDQF